MGLKLNTKIILGFIIAVGVLLLTSVTSWYSIQQLSYYTQQVEHTYQVLQGTANIRTHMRDAQSHIRSYLLLADTTALTSFRQLQPEAHADFEQLHRLTLDNLRQQSRLDTLKRLMADEIAYLARWTDRRPSGEAVRELVLGDRDRQLQLRNLLIRVRLEEEALLAQRRQQQDMYENITPVAVVVSAVLAALIVLWLFRQITREVRANEALQQELSRSNDEVARRIQIIEALANRVVQGDYTVKITDQEQDSLGNLATALNRMTQTLDTNFTALENRNRELDQFAYVASHDLKAPLRGVVTVVKWIEDELPHELSPQMRQYLEMMKGRLYRLEDLINGLLAYARAGRTEQKLEEVSVQQLVQEVAELVVPPTFRVATPTPLPTFVTDRLSLQQVFTNLMGNAAKYHHRPDGLITVTCRDMGECYEFRVQDDGPGIAPQFHQKVFLMFQTLRDRHTAESTGIGLSIVKRIIEERKGTIHLESAEGAGASFIFTWPK
ncbi:signal transduction histidine kinase [Hymenobacter luteus]|uniref:histidine kinase n=2 Tax=Hymenobacter TaxID=89966 RepID=A0A7W9WDD6_9BACT|nr:MULTISPECIES: ATP-binding protein [Hymenobacter]MBB4602549.1 signal transduction histidine kinase [Hymenobacter latericoloratus]MBB6060440.1 signal transduction histidine kinase [Hymenobacter luteus]